MRDHDNSKRFFVSRIEASELLRCAYCDIKKYNLSLCWMSEKTRIPRKRLNRIFRSAHANPHELKRIITHTLSAVARHTGA